MMTVDDIGTAVREGRLALDDALAMFDTDEVVVYPELALTPGEETWQQVEAAATVSTVFADLRTAGATPEQMDEVGVQVERLRGIGNTMDVVFGWSPDD